MSAAVPFRFAIPVRGGEIRVAREGQECALELWAVYPGRALMRGAITIACEDIDLLIHGLKRAAWLRDRSESLGTTGKASGSAP
jgi:hypothetical protein